MTLNRKNEASIDRSNCFIQYNCQYRLPWKYLRWSMVDLRFIIVRKSWFEVRKENIQFSKVLCEINIWSGEINFFFNDWTWASSECVRKRKKPLFSSFFVFFFALYFRRRILRNDCCFWSFAICRRRWGEKKSIRWMFSMLFFLSWFG